MAPVKQTNRKVQALAFTVLVAFQYVPLKGFVITHPQNWLKRLLESPPKLNPLTREASCSHQGSNKRQVLLFVLMQSTNQEVKQLMLDSKTLGESKAVDLKVQCQGMSSVVGSDQLM